MLKIEKKATMFFNFDAGFAYLIDEDGFNTYRIVYAGTPKVLEYKANNDEHYTVYGMSDPTKIYWNEPLKNSIVVPEKIACQYFAKENCKRFSVYKPAVKHPATDETLRGYYYEWKKIGKIRSLTDTERQKVMNIIKKAIWSEEIDYSTLSTLPISYAEPLKKSLEKPLVLSSRSTAEESYILSCNKQTNQPEVLFVVPNTYFNKARQLGEILKTDEKGRIGVYLDANTRIPVPDVNCSSFGNGLPTLNTTVTPSNKVVKESQNYKEDLTELLKKLFGNYKVRNNIQTNTTVSNPIAIPPKNGSRNH